MPREIISKEEFEKLLPTATEIRVLRKGDSTKIKIRTAQPALHVQDDGGRRRRPHQGHEDPGRRVLDEAAKASESRQPQRHRYRQAREHLRPREKVEGDHDPDVHRGQRGERHSEPELVERECREQRIEYGVARPDRELARAWM